MIDLLEGIHQIVQKQGKYPAAAYVMIYNTLHWLQEKGQEGHIAGPDLARAVFFYTIDTCGFLAKTVWQQLKLERSEDIGEMVYHLVDANLIGKVPTDNQSDFDNVLMISDFDLVKLNVTGQKGDLKIEYILPELRRE
jgi:uncharacterized repeat protein (TIGR04138 family)